MLTYLGELIEDATTSHWLTKQQMLLYCVKCKGEFLHWRIPAKLIESKSSMLKSIHQNTKFGGRSDSTRKHWIYKPFQSSQFTFQNDDEMNGQTYLCLLLTEFN